MKVEYCCLARNQAEIPASPSGFVFYAPDLELDYCVSSCASVVLMDEPEATACTLLENGVHRVMLGESALRDKTLVTRLSGRYGPGRLGLHVPVRRQAVNWSFDTESNADFSVVTPSLCAPSWEVLLADAEPSGILAQPWIETMLSYGVQSVLLRADIGDDTDLNLCAGMAEVLGDRLWLAPLSVPILPVSDWTLYGQASQIALPPNLYQQREKLLAEFRDAVSLTTQDQVAARA